jgi:hypothetical protein
MSAGNRMKAKGTAFETMVCNWLISHGFTRAYRPATSGSYDTGDINGIVRHYGVNHRQAIIQCKNAKTFNLSGWLNDANDQAAQPKVGGDALPIVVFKRPGIGAVNLGDTYALLRLEDLRSLLHEAGYS